MNKPVKYYIDPRTPVVDEMIEEYGERFERMTNEDRIFLISEVSELCTNNIWYESSGTAMTIAKNYRRYATDYRLELTAFSAPGILRALTDGFTILSENYTPFSVYETVLNDIQGKYGANLGLMTQSMRFFFAFSIIRDLETMWIGKEPTETMKNFAQQIREQITCESEADAIEVLKMFVNSL